ALLEDSCALLSARGWSADFRGRSSRWGDLSHHEIARRGTSQDQAAHCQRKDKSSHAIGRAYCPPEPRSSRLKYSSRPTRNSSGNDGPESPVVWEAPRSSRTSLSLTPPPSRASAESWVVPCPPPPGIEPPPPPPRGLIRLDWSRSSITSVSAAMAG